MIVAVWFEDCLIYVGVIGAIVYDYRFICDFVFYRSYYFKDVFVQFVIGFLVCADDQVVVFSAP